MSKFLLLNFFILSVINLPFSVEASLLEDSPASINIRSTYSVNNLSEIPDLTNPARRNGYHALPSDVSKVTRKNSILQKAKHSALNFSNWLFNGVIYTFQSLFSAELLPENVGEETIDQY